jgi:hypothetical protein
MSKSVTITLGGKSYEIAEAPMRKNAAWRAGLSALLVDLGELMESASTVELNSVADLIGVVRQIQDVILAAPDRLTAMLFDYSPVLAADRARIEADVYESELIGAFVEVLKLAYPFGDLLTLANGWTPTFNASTSTS